MSENYKQIRTLSIKFDLAIRYEDIPKFRGAVVNLTKEKNDLFHNHSEDGLIYRYPKIQYKKSGGKAAILCLDEGTEAIEDFFAGFNQQFIFGSEAIELKVEEIKARQFNAGLWEETFDYRLANWLPLNQENYKQFHEVESLHEKIAILEKVLTGNLLTFCEGIGITPDRQVKAFIIKIVNEKRIRYRGTVMQSYDVDIRTNISLPDFIGLGKGSGVGYGVVTSGYNRLLKNDKK